jgi:hypothetical protein
MRRIPRVRSAYRISKILMRPRRANSRLRTVPRLHQGARRVPRPARLLSDFFPEQRRGHRDGVLRIRLRHLPARALTPVLRISYHLAVPNGSILLLIGEVEEEEASVTGRRDRQPTSTIIPVKAFEDTHRMARKFLCQSRRNRRRRCPKSFPKVKRSPNEEADKDVAGYIERIF